MWKLPHARGIARCARGRFHVQKRVDHLFNHHLSCIDSLVSLIHWFHLRSCHVIGISNAIGSFLDAPRDLNLSLLLHFTDVPISHWIVLVPALFESSAPAWPDTPDMYSMLEDSSYCASYVSYHIISYLHSTLLVMLILQCSTLHIMCTW